MQNNDSPESCSNWAYLTDPILLKIFCHLSPREIINAGATCKHWNEVSYDNLLWRSKFRKEHRIDDSLELKLGTCWYDEFKRLVDNVPLVATEILKCHSASVLHVSFSHNGNYFVTCSLDALVVVWHSSYPADIKYTHDMKEHHWKFSHYSEFNESDTLLLVSGGHFGTLDDSSGEIGMFSMEDENMTLICRILNKPYDVFGTFYSEACIFSGQSHPIENLICSSSIWLHKACPDVVCEHKPLMSRIFRFLNVNASFIRCLVVARCNENVSTCVSHHSSSSTPNETGFNTDGDDEYYNRDFRRKARMEACKRKDKLPWFMFERDYSSCGVPITSNVDSDTEYSASDSEDEGSCLDSDEDLDSQPEKFLIFTTGSKTNTPHQIGIKRVGRVNFPKKLDPGPSLAERIAERKERAKRPPVVFDNIDIRELSRSFDSVDHLIEMHGHIIGMKLSPDHRYLYVNCRPWPEGYVIANPLDPPPVAQEIDIHVIDLQTLKEVGGMLRAHKGYTPSEECGLIFLDVCNDYIASGSEDKYAYLWDRHYGIGLTKFPHVDVVNGVAFNPKDQEILVTVSQDSWIKIWRSRARTRELGIDNTECPKAVRIPQRAKQRRRNS